MNPGCRVGDIRRAGWVVYRDYATYQDLNKLRDTEGYNIPSEDVLKQILFTDNATSGADNITMTLPEGMLGYPPARPSAQLQDVIGPDQRRR